MARFVDSNVFLYVMREAPKHGEAARGILARIEAGEEAVTSTVKTEETERYGSRPIRLAREVKSGKSLSSPQDAAETVRSLVAGVAFGAYLIPFPWL